MIEQVVYDARPLIEALLADRTEDTTFELNGKIWRRRIYGGWMLGAENGEKRLCQQNVVGKPDSYWSRFALGQVDGQEHQVYWIFDLTGETKRRHGSDYEYRIVDGMMVRCHAD